MLIQHVQPKDEEKINDLNEEIESAARASWVKLFQKDTADRTQDEQMHWFVQKVGEVRV